MSKIYDALQKAEAERRAPEAEPGDATVVTRAARRTWWRGMLAGALLALAGTALVLAYIARTTPSPPATAPRRAGDGIPAEGAPPSAGIGDLQPASAPPVAPVLATPAPADATLALPVTTRVDVVPGPPATADTTLGAAPDDKRASAAPGGAPSPPARPASGVWVQLGAFRERANAEALLAALARGGEPAAIRAGPSPDAPWTVRVGPFPDRSTAEATRRALARAGRTGFLVRD